MFAKYNFYQTNRNKFALFVHLNKNRMHFYWMCGVTLAFHIYLHCLLSNTLWLFLSLSLSLSLSRSLTFSDCISVSLGHTLSLSCYLTFLSLSLQFPKKSFSFQSEHPHLIIKSETFCLFYLIFRSRKKPTVQLNKCDWTTSQWQPPQHQQSLLCLPICTIRINYVFAIHAGVVHCFAVGRNTVTNIHSLNNIISLNYKLSNIEYHALALGNLYFFQTKYKTPLCSSM